ncbi:hypothetical protein Syun_010830 [Stephania yunnanensis]|uniref:Uncharacterized protein n=1 Tax=Stephania yunnanensis TaxID=152371 RepID=A0AAP0PHP2_9MAGN
MVRNSSFSCEMGFQFSCPLAKISLDLRLACCNCFSALSYISSFPVQLLHARFLDDDVLGNW